VSNEVQVSPSVGRPNPTSVPPVTITSRAAEAGPSNGSRIDDGQALFMSTRIVQATAGIWQSRKREWWPRAVLLAVALLIFGALFLVLFPQVLFRVDLRGERHLPSIDRHFGILVIVACFLPPSLSWLAYLLINKRAIYQSVRPTFPASIDPNLVSAALATWNYEIGKAQWSLSRAEVFAGMWGIMTSATIVGAVSFLIPPFHPAGTAFDGPRTMAAFAVIGAAGTSFLLDLSRVCLRAANDDATKRMFAEAFRSLILAVITTLAVVLLARLDDAKWLGAPMSMGGKEGVDAVLISLGVGAGVAVMGSSAFEWMQTRVSTLFGMSRRVGETGTPLNTLGGVGEAESARLAEESIECVEALVNTPIPRLFLNTRFSLRRIAEWHDMGLLIVRVGREAAADLHGRWGIRGAVEVSRAVSELDSDPRSLETLRAIFRKTMRVDDDTQAELVLRQMAADDRVAMTEVFRHTSVIEEEETNPRAPLASVDSTLPSRAH
jgi:hypothetical protein